MAVATGFASAHSARSDTPGGPCFILGGFPRDVSGRRGLGSDTGRGNPDSGPGRREVEVMSGFEPLNNAFAERSLTTWVHHRRAEVKKKRWNFNQSRRPMGLPASFLSLAEGCPESSSPRESLHFFNFRGIFFRALFIFTRHGLARGPHFEYSFFVHKHRWELT